MAIRTDTFANIGASPVQDNAHDLAALPVGSTAAVFSSHQDAVHAAGELAAGGRNYVWMATGEPAAKAIQQARTSRPLFARLANLLSDDATLVGRIIAGAGRDRTVLVVRTAGPEALSRLTGASHIVQFGRWTIRVVR